MKITTNIEPKEFTKGLTFYGETRADKKVVEQINELRVFLGDVLFEIQKLEWEVAGRDEASAEEINKAIQVLKNEVTTFYSEFEEEGS